MKRSAETIDRLATKFVIVVTVLLLIAIFRILTGS